MEELSFKPEDGGGYHIETSPLMEELSFKPEVHIEPTQNLRWSVLQK